MQNVNVDAKSLWMQFEDVLAPRLGLTSKERVVYSYLLRHSLVVGKTRVQFPLIGLGRLLGFSATSARHAVRRLEDLEVLRIVKRNNDGHLAEMSLPENIRATRERGNSLSFAKRASGGKSAAKLDALDFFSSRALRKAIHDRERGACFLLPSPESCYRPVPRPRGASRSSRTQLLPQSRLVLYRMQLP